MTAVLLMNKPDYFYSIKALTITPFSLTTLSITIRNFMMLSILTFSIMVHSNHIEKDGTQLNYAQNSE
jgi:hypothetical protein